jgi:vacuolar-type H+-ATPase subunit F/Vma7
MVSFSLCLRGVRMAVVANKKTIYLMKLMGFRAFAYQETSDFAGHRLRQPATAQS